MFEKMVYGIEFYRHPGPELEQLISDMDFYKAKGFTLIRIQEVWSYEEPLQGKYDFDKIKGMLAHAEKIGMEVVITFSLECAPPWLYKNHDVFHRNALREPVGEVTPYPLPSDGKPGPCWDNPIAKAAAESFVSAFITELGSYEVIKGWAVWQEASLWPLSDIRGQAANSLCHCEHTLDKFRLWLKNKYQNLENLNKQLMTNYGDWSYIETSRGLTNANMNPLANQFYNFMRERMNDIASWKKEIVNRYDIKKRPVMCHTVFSMLQSGIAPKWDDDYMIAKNMDIYGTSLYPKWFGSRECNEQVKYIAFTVDGCRAAAGDKEIWAAELQAGKPGYGLKRWPEPLGREIENWNMMCLARGAKGFVQWQYREEILLAEANGHGLLNRRGQAVPWLASLTDLMSFFKNYENIIKQGKVEKSKLAIAVNTDSYILAHQTGFDELVAKAAMNLYGTLFDMNVFADFIWQEDILQDKLFDYPILFLPFPVSMSKECAEVLKRYVKNGGILISEACPAIYDELSNCTQESPGFGLDEVFGCVEKDIIEVMYEKEDLDSQEELKLSGENLLSGIEITTNHFIQVYTLTTGEKLASWKADAAGVKNSYGKGQAYIIGTFFGQPEANSALVRRLLNLVGIDSFENDQPLISKLSSHLGEASFLYNRQKTETVVDLPAKADLVFAGHYGGSLKEEAGCLRITIPAESTVCVIFGVDGLVKQG